jgi:hypothetical protein
MAASTTPTATQQKFCCSCEEMLRQQWLHLHRSGLSALPPLMHRTANGSFEERPTSVQNAANGGKEPTL